MKWPLLATGKIQQKVSELPDTCLGLVQQRRPCHSYTTIQTHPGYLAHYYRKEQVTG